VSSIAQRSQVGAFVALQQEPVQTPG